MTFSYKAITDKGEHKEGTISATNRDSAISALQRRGFIVVSVTIEEEKGFLKKNLFEKVSVKEVVVLSRQISTLFEAQVSALKAFSLLAGNTENSLLKRKLNQVVDDLQAGNSISGALSKHSDVFSDFYINMVRAGEESGKLNQTFIYLADYLDRQYALTSKTKNALIYPAFVIFTFFAVMILMFVVVIPKLSAIILESAQTVPLYTRIVIGVSNFTVQYGIFFAIFFIIALFYVWRMSLTPKGKLFLDRVKLSTPVVGDLFHKLYLSRISDNMDTMLSSGIAIVRSIEITGSVVGNSIYENIMKEAAEAVKEGRSLSQSFESHPEVPSILVQMIRVGEETGSLAQILRTLAHFYKREVDDAVDTMVGLIEPIMIVLLGLGVGVLLTSVLVPIYNIASGIE